MRSARRPTARAARDPLLAVRVALRELVDRRAARRRSSRDRHARVQRRVRVLEDDLHLPPQRRSSAGESAMMSLPSKRSRPRSARCSRRMVRPSVLLPQPTRRPGRASRRGVRRSDTPSTARTLSAIAREHACATGKYFESRPTACCVASRRLDGARSATAASSAASLVEPRRVDGARSRSRRSGQRSTRCSSAARHRRRSASRRRRVAAQRSAKRQPVRQIAQRSAPCPGSSRSRVRLGPPLPRLVDVRNASASRPARVGVPRAREQRRRRGACSTTRPAYITTTSSPISATTPRSCVISMIAMPSSSLQLAQQLEDLRLDRHVERGRRLVGDQQLRARTPAPSRSSRAAACRPRAGADTRRRAARARECRRARSISIARAARLARDIFWCSRDRLDDLLADGVAPGSATSSAPGRSSRSALPRIVAHLALAQRQQIVPVEAGSRRRRSGPADAATSRMIDSAVTLLPQPLRRRCRACRRRDVERDAVHRAQTPLSVWNAVTRFRTLSSDSDIAGRSYHESSALASCQALSAAEGLVGDLADVLAQQYPQCRAASADLAAPAVGAQPLASAWRRRVDHADHGDDHRMRRGCQRLSDVGAGGICLWLPEGEWRDAASHRAVLLLDRRHRIAAALRALRHGRNRPEHVAGPGKSGRPVPHLRQAASALNDLRRAQAEAEVRCF